MQKCAKFACADTLKDFLLLVNWIVCEVYWRILFLCRVCIFNCEIIVLTSLWTGSLFGERVKNREAREAKGESLSSF